MWTSSETGTAKPTEPKSKHNGVGSFGQALLFVFWFVLFWFRVFVFHILLTCMVFLLLFTLYVFFFQSALGPLRIVQTLLTGKRLA